MKRKTLAGAALGAAVLAVAVLSACADSLSAGTDTPPAERPTFTAPEAAAATPSPEAGLCNAYECPSPYATCPGTSGLCTTNLSNDIGHCGTCDNECPSSIRIRQTLHASFACAKSRCQMICTPSWGDCDGFVDDGCETSLDDDPKNCGICGAACSAGEICWRGACGCPAGYTRCGNDCVKLADDDLNCGSCGHACSEPAADAGAATWPCGSGNYPPHTGFNCATSACGFHCASGFANCNTDVCGDGCEVSVTDDHENCGACGHACTAAQACVQGKCICDADKTRCGTDCVDLETDARNCGACGNACPGSSGDDLTSHGSPVCVLGRCGYACPPGFADCDHRIENGCEVDLMVDPTHCGSCTAQCDLAGGQPCAGGQCLTKPCDAGVVH
ncbi:MAG: Tryptophan synthase alpha chain [Myxococcaceae bacterium]|nr:Tryptophan synthase alpha chain [Myxococcaceae bacterium]